jgi:acyl-CoA synthetase (AMP-forming)/AMP-acid ligase II
MLSHTIEAADGLPLTLPELLRQRASEHADRLLLVCDDERLTYAQAEARSRLLARGLLAAGAGKGSHVAVLYPNSPGFAVAAYAAMRIGAVLVPISTFSTVDELRWLLANSDAGYLIATPSFRSHNYAELLASALPELDFSRPPPLRSKAAPMLRRIWLDGALPAGRDPGWSIASLEAGASAIDDALLDAVEARVMPADRMVILHSSGSTGTPKGVIHNHGAYLRHLNNCNETRGFATRDILFSNSPWFWVAGNGYSFLGTLLAGGRLICSNAVAPTEMLDFLERERPTMSNGYWQPMARLAADPSFPKRDLSTMRRGNLYPILPPDVRPQDYELRHNMYGMTEVGGNVTMSGDESILPERLRGSFGKVLPGYEARIVDPETGKDCPPGEMGELWVRGPLMMEGYYGKARSQVFEPDGWWRTNDLGRFDAEGHFFYTGRRGDMIKTSGANVPPREVEAALRGLIDERQCYVFGVPDAQRGQIVVAVIVAQSEHEVDEAALKQLLAKKLSSYKVPRHILRFGQAELPMVSSGQKVDTRRLIELAQQRLQRSQAA